VRPLPAFLLFTFVASWILFGLGGLAGVATPVSGLPIASGVLIFLGTIVPSLVALAMTARERGPGAARALLSRIVENIPGWRWWMFAVFYMAAIKLAAAVLHRLIAGHWPAFGHTPIALMLLAIVFSTPVQAGEEIGWRGYALPRLAREVGLGRAGVLLGVIWALWHLPLFYIAGTDTYRQSFPTFLVSVMAVSVAMTWLYWRTGGSLLMTMVMHAAINNTTGIVPAAGRNADPSDLHITLVGGLTLALLWLGAGYFLTRLRGARLADAQEA